MSTIVRFCVYVVFAIFSVVSTSKASPLWEGQFRSRLLSSKLSRSASYNTLKYGDWDFFTLSYSWPQTFCTLERDNDKTVKCEIPPKVNNLTIHGLWPSSSNKSDEPFNCNNTWAFDFSQIKDLESRLLVEWPNVLPARGKTSLWSHEWQKHGTCAASVPVLNSQHNYFSKTLDLKDMYDLLTMLQSHGIVPSDDAQYEYDNVFNALKESLTTKPYLECYIPLENPKVFYIAEMRFCMDREFNLIDCEKSALSKFGFKTLQRENQPCSSKLKLMIPTIKH